MPPLLVREVYLAQSENRHQASGPRQTFSANILPDRAGGPGPSEPHQESGTLWSNDSRAGLNSANLWLPTKSTQKTAKSEEPPDSKSGVDLQALHMSSSETESIDSNPLQHQASIKPEDPSGVAAKPEVVAGSEPVIDGALWSSRPEARLLKVSSAHAQEVSGAGQPQPTVQPSPADLPSAAKKPRVAFKRMSEILQPEALVLLYRTSLK